MPLAEATPTLGLQKNEARRCYFGYGSIRPPLTHLVEISDALRMDAGLSRELALAETDLEIAVLDPSQADSRLSEAETLLTSVKNTGDKVLKTGSQKELRHVTEQAILARIRLAELDNWSRVAEGEIPKTDYLGLLKAALETYHYMPSGEHIAEAKVLEFIPVLLGARAAIKGRKGSWGGRMALLREDKSAIPGTVERRVTWDNGLSKKFGIDGFLNPEVRINVKKSYAEHRTRFARGGVTLLVAKQCGFEDAPAVIKGCLDELNVLPQSDSYNVEAKTSDELDMITSTIYARAFIKDRPKAQAA